MLLMGALMNFEAVQMETLFLVSNIAMVLSRDMETVEMETVQK